MEIQSIKLIYFSPTGTTKNIVQEVARKVDVNSIELVDITSPKTREKPLRIKEDELIIVGVPVYMGRVPTLASDWLSTISVCNAPAICVVVYGNRVYDNALLELRDLLTNRGAKSIAGAAFIGEHSFSSTKLPTAEGRPDINDLKLAEKLGRAAKEKLLRTASLEQVSEANIPGQYPYEGITKLWDVDFIAVSEACTQCGTCAEKCPTGATESGKSFSINNVKCITCCACIKNCPNGAKSIKSGEVMDAAIRLNSLYRDRKEPELFL